HQGMRGWADGRSCGGFIAVMLVELGGVGWGAAWSGASDTSDRAVGALEGGDVLFLPGLAFAIGADERVLFSPSIAAAKNVSFDPLSGRVCVADLCALGDRGADFLRGLLHCFSYSESVMVGNLLSYYRAHL